MLRISRPVSNSLAPSAVLVTEVSLAIASPRNQPAIWATVARTNPPPHTILSHPFRFEMASSTFWSVATRYVAHHTGEVIRGLFRARKTPACIVVVDSPEDVWPTVFQGFRREARLTPMHGRPSRPRTKAATSLRSPKAASIAGGQFRSVTQVAPPACESH